MNHDYYNTPIFRNTIKSIDDEWNEVYNKVRLIDKYFIGKSADDLKNKILENDDLIIRIKDKLKRLDSKINDIENGNRTSI